MHNRSYTRHRRYHLHGSRLVFFGVALLALCLVRIDATAISPVTPVATSQVLAYATNINRGDLLAQTNASRAQNGLAPLTLDSQLNTAAQNKSQHMITHNYWSHVAPDGTQPWYFFDQAGYVYQNAGENLAYGFDSSSGTVTAWMNSPSHRSNILGDYVDVGFGIANGDNYQGGQNTVVVAHYGKRQYSAPTTPAPTSPAPTPPTQSPSPAAAPTSNTPTAQTPATPAPQSPTAQTEETSQPAATQQEASQEAATPIAGTAKPSVNTANSKNVSLYQAVSNGSAPIYGIASLALLMTSAVGFFLTHRALINHAVVTSEAYVIKHPMVDIATVGAISLLALSTTVSRI